jgi:very-short-patch-repair endonuclease
MTTQAKPKGKGRKPPAHFTPEFQRWARSHVSSESCRINGAKGFKATLAKHGPDVPFKGARQWRLDHPSGNELVVIGILSQLGITYEREWQIGDTLYTVDFYLPMTRQAIAVHSNIHKQFDQEQRRRRESRKLKLLRERGIKCLTVWDRELAKDAAAVIRKIKRFIEKAQ